MEWGEDENQSREHDNVEDREREQKVMKRMITMKMGTRMMRKKRLLLRKKKMRMTVKKKQKDQ